MKITTHLTDEAVMKELGQRLLHARLGCNLTQAALAEQAGVSKRSVERLESGEVATQLSGLLRVCRILGLLERFDALIPETVISPMEQLKSKIHKRQRASSRKKPKGKPTQWTWGDGV